jgi:hypothetical protein
MSMRERCMAQQLHRVAKCAVVHSGHFTVGERFHCADRSALQRTEDTDERKQSDDCAEDQKTDAGKIHGPLAWQKAGEAETPPAEHLPRQRDQP